MSELDAKKENTPDFLDANFWDERWKANETAWDLQAVSPPLKSYIDGISDRHTSILIPGCGNAYEAEYLLNNGFTNVTVIDIAPTLVKQLLEKFSAFAGNQLTVICGDFFKHSGQYDYIIEQTFFCALDKNKREAYVTKMHTLLNENGKLAGLLFDKEFEKGPPFGGCKEEYTQLLGKQFAILTMEPCAESVKPRAGTELFFQVEKN